MKSAAANLGVLRLSKMAATLEHKLANEQVNGQDESIVQLRHEFEKAKNEIEALSSTGF